ncbi:LysR family transcriptional regulator [Streptomyces sp. NPDC020800]|uniref:LysR family transcriptional regulator n=1 Tax=Streptomyces sp. NPDC020800 TaxID=3365092 RepID=UPI0037950C2D
MRQGADLAMLRTFLCVYRCGGVAKAAGLLGLSQPAVSRHLKILETTVGRPLFNRRRRGVVPTPAGDLLATQIAAHLDALEDAVGAFKPSGATSPVMLGAPADLLAVHIVPRLIPLLAHGIELHCRIGLSPELTEALVHNELDLVVVTKTEETLTRQLYLGHICEEEFVLVGRAGEAPYSPKNHTRSFIGYSTSMPMARRYFRTCWDMRPPAPALTVADLRTVVSAVAAGAGLSVVPRSVAQRSLDAGRLSVLHTPHKPVTNSIYLATRRGRQHFPPIRAAFDLLCPSARDATLSSSS